MKHGQEGLKARLGFPELGDGQSLTRENSIFPIMIFVYLQVFQNFSKTTLNFKNELIVMSMQTTIETTLQKKSDFGDKSVIFWIML